MMILMILTPLKMMMMPHRFDALLPPAGTLLQGSLSLLLLLRSKVVLVGHLPRFKIKKNILDSANFFSLTSDDVDDSTDSCTGFESRLFFSGAGLLNGLTIAIAFPLKVFLNDLATLLQLLDADDLVDFESESESDSIGLLFDFVGRRIGCGLSTWSSNCSRFWGVFPSGRSDEVAAVTDSGPLGGFSLKEGLDELGSVLVDEQGDLDFNFVVLLLCEGLLLSLVFGGGLLGGNLFGVAGGLCFFFGLSELTLRLFRGCNLPERNRIH